MSRLTFTKKQKKRITTKTLLKLLAEGTLLTIDTFLSLGRVPNAAKILLGEIPQEYYPSSVIDRTWRLYRKGLVKVSETKEGYRILITKKGKAEQLRFNLETMEIHTPEYWDGKWRIVFFDIPEKYKKQRDFLCQKLKALNFYLIQESVFIHPFDCEQEIEFLREVLEIPHQVKTGVLEKVENEKDLKRIFKNLLKNIS